MTIHEYGKDNQKIIVLIHPSVVMWDYFEYITPLLEGKFHLIIPALPGYDEKNPKQDFTSIENIADNLAKWLKSHNIQTVDLLYGCSMGGSIVLRMLAERKNHNQKCDLRRWYNALSASVDCYKANCGQRFSHDIHGKNRRTWTS